MPGDHASIPHHWYSKYVTKLSDVAEAYSATSGWGNDVINRRTGEKVWEPMPLVHGLLSLFITVVYKTWNAYAFRGKTSG